MVAAGPSIEDQIENIKLRIAKAKPIKAPSYLTPPSQLAGTTALLNIRNGVDENCSLNCYAAAYHLMYGPRLFPVVSSSRRITTYGLGNPMAKKANGEVIMPIGFYQIAGFEEFNDV